MASSQIRQPPLATSTRNSHREEWHRILIPVPNHDEFYTIEDLNTRHTHDVLAHCQELFETYRETGDVTWLEKRRLTLQQWLVRFDAMNVHLAQCKNAVWTALELSQPHGMNDPYERPEDPPRRVVIGGPETPPLPRGSFTRRRRPQHAVPIPVKEEEGDPLSPRSYLDKKISASWHAYTYLRFTLKYNGLDADPPDWYFARKEHGQWVGSGLRWEYDGVKIKKYLVLSTPRNLAIVYHALNFLRNHKETLEDERVETSSPRDDEPLQIMVIEVGSNRQIFASGRILLRDIDVDGNEEIRSPLSGEKIEQQDTTANDLIFPVEERTFRDIYNLHEDIAADIDARDEAAERERRGSAGDASA
ncbi:hypothetical protein F4774DRAFT_426335 [Daldinia eschscholtzii]|nr:hypothetical protein F4774DRAFT_426335 [Daldinia eschscholtzii]